MEIMFVLGMTEKEVEKYKTELEQSELFYFYDEWVFINNEMSYCDYQGRDRVMKSKEKELEKINPDILGYFKGLKRGYKGVSNPLLNHKPKTINHKRKGGMGEKQKNGLNDISETQIQEIAEKYQVPVAFVRSKYDDLKNYCASKGKRYKDYPATLRDWVKRDALKVKGGGENGYKAKKIVSVG